MSLKPVLNRVPVEILKFYLVEASLGVDCSGFVVNVLDEFLQEKIGISLYQVIPRKAFPSFWRWLVFKLRPRLNLSAKILTSNFVSQPIGLHEVKSGDLIKFGSSHVALISSVWRKSNEIKKIEYVHSTSDYGDQHGVRKDLIIIKNPSLPLERQLWQENDSKGCNWTKKDYLSAPPKERGLRRLIVLTC